MPECSDRKAPAENTRRPQRGRDIFGTERELSDFLAHRTIIDQAKGMLMLVYDVDARTAFEVLRRRSQETNVKLWQLAQQLLEDVPRATRAETPALRATCDQVLLTAHERVRPSRSPSDD